MIRDHTLGSLPCFKRLLPAYLLKNPQSKVGSKEEGNPQAEFCFPTSAGFSKKNEIDPDKGIQKKFRQKEGKDCRKGVLALPGNHAASPDGLHDEIRPEEVSPECFPTGELDVIESSDRCWGATSPFAELSIGPPSPNEA